MKLKNDTVSIQKGKSSRSGSDAKKTEKHPKKAALPEAGSAAEAKRKNGFSLKRKDL